MKKSIYIGCLLFCVLQQSNATVVQLLQKALDDSTKLSREVLVISYNFRSSQGLPVAPHLPDSKNQVVYKLSDQSGPLQRPVVIDNDTSASAAQQHIDFSNISKDIDAKVQALYQNVLHRQQK